MCHSPVGSFRESSPVDLFSDSSPVDLSETPIHLIFMWLLSSGSFCVTPVQRIFSWLQSSGQLKPVATGSLFAFLPELSRGESVQSFSSYVDMLFISTSLFRGSCPISFQIPGFLAQAMRLIVGLLVSQFIIISRSVRLSFNSYSPVVCHPGFQ